MKKIIFYVLSIAMAITVLMPVGVLADVQYTDNVIPIMTSTTTPEGVVTANGYNATSWYCFDRNIGVCWAPYFSGSIWISYEFSQPKVIKQYTITSDPDVTAGTNKAPKSWTFSASNNGTSWVVLDTQTNIGGWGSSVKQKFAINNNNEYKIYKLSVTALTSASETKASIAEIEMMEGTTVIIPVAPTNLNTNAGNNEVSLSWNTEEGASGYNVKRATVTGGPYETVASAVYQNSYVDTTVTNGTTYYYVVTAVNSAGESEYSNEASATPFIPVTVPSAPANLTPTSGDSKVDINWNASEGAVTYNVKRSTTAGGPYTTVAEGVTQTTYTDTVVSNVTTYYYVVTAVNTAGESVPSNEASAKPAATQTSSGKIMIKTDDGLIYSGDLVEQTSELFKLKNVYLYNGIPSFSSSNQPTYNWEISFYKNKVIWFYFGN